MTEEEQARALARWLDDPSGAPPPDVDPDVLEAIGLLRPELAPAHAVTADSVWSADKAERVVPLAQHRGWRRWMGSAGGAGVLLAAAISGVIFLPNAPWMATSPPQQMGAQTHDLMMASEPMAEAGDEAEAAEALSTVEVASETAPVDAPPSAAPKTVTPPPQRQLQAADVPTVSQPALPTAGAVAPAPTRTEAMGTTDVREAPSPRIAQSDGGAIAESTGSGGLTLGASGRAYRAPAAPPPRAMTPAAAPSEGKRGVFQRSAKRRTMDMEVAQEDAPEALEAYGAMEDDATEAVEPLLALRRDVVARLGPFPGTADSENLEQKLLHDAREALDGGDPSRTLTVCAQALALGDGPTPERRWLALLRGDAYRALSRDTDAESSYREAMTGKVR